MMNSPPYPFHFELSWHYLAEQMSHIGPPFLLGCATSGLVMAVIGYFAVRGIWRYSVVRSWEKRKLRLPKKIKEVLPNPNKPS
jgi:Uncharacterized protein conserved in bacteria